MNSLMSEVQGFAGSLECTACEKLLEYYNEGNQAAFIEQAGKTIVTQIFPVNIVRVLKKVRVKSVGLTSNAQAMEMAQGDPEEIRQQNINNMLL